jgi:hypothetical protein
MTPRGIRLGWVLIALWTTFPIISVFIAGAIAYPAGCHLDEASAHSCIVLGRDIGPLLSQMAVMGWLFLLTMPSGLIASGIHRAAITTEARWEREFSETFLPIGSEQPAEENRDSSPPTVD